eukprot:GHVR01180000.1.p1 GENE.GHVR01180000.1~~GHVR01180000.1.p1  ORF type:complete len:261 (+),score=112.58 GHVR01180000.1:375-1157(+)
MQADSELEIFLNIKNNQSSANNNNILDQSEDNIRDGGGVDGNMDTHTILNEIFKLDIIVADDLEDFNYKEIELLLTLCKSKQGFFGTIPLCTNKSQVHLYDLFNLIKNPSYDDTHTHTYDDTHTHTLDNPLMLFKALPHTYNLGGCVSEFSQRIGSFLRLLSGTPTTVTAASQVECNMCNINNGGYYFDDYNENNNIIKNNNYYMNKYLNSYLSESYYFTQYLSARTIGSSIELKCVALKSLLKKNNNNTEMFFKNGPSP